MIDNLKQAIHDQYLAAFRTLKHCIDKCSDEAWNQPVCNHEFCQAAFHALFFADVYLGPSPEAVNDQAFHKEHAETFAGYEEWESKPPEKRYTREFIDAYLDHCKSKAVDLINGSNDESLNTQSGFHWIPGTAVEVHIYNIRHLQHHAAQLSLRLRLDSSIAVPWVRSGWVNDE